MENNAKRESFNKHFLSDSHQKEQYQLNIRNQEDKKEGQIDKEHENEDASNEENEELMELPSEGSFPFECDYNTWNWGQSGDEPTQLIKQSQIDCNDEVLLYVSEIFWLQSCRVFLESHYSSEGIGLPIKKHSLIATNTIRPMEHLLCTGATAAFLYRPTRRNRKRPRLKSPTSEFPPSKRPVNAIVMIPCSPSTFQSSGLNPSDPTIMTCAPSVSCSSSYFAAFPEEFRRLLASRWIDPDSKVLLGASRRLRRRYGELAMFPQNSDILIDPCGLKTSQVSADGKSYAPSSLLLNPMESCQLPSLMTHLQATSSHGGTASPVSPVPIENSVSGQGTLGSQPIMVRKNRLQQCIIHSDSNEEPSSSPPSFPSNEEKSKLSGGWQWDKEEPLSLPGLCSCIDDQHYRLWQSELDLHRNYCAKELQKNISIPNLKLVDWLAVKEGNFKSFLNDLNVQRMQNDGTTVSKTDSTDDRAFEQLRFCNQCGGLTYIPYSFIEITLNRDIPTLAELVRKLPLPIPTEMFCDGLRITGSIVARSPLHEWLILCTLQFVDLQHTCRVYDVCPSLIYPFHRLPDRWQSMQPPSSIEESSKRLSEPCLRHRLMHLEPPSKAWVAMEPHRMAHPQQRRPYCLSLRKRLEYPFPKFKDQMPSDVSFLMLESSCWEWLSNQIVSSEVRPVIARGSQSVTASPRAHSRTNTDGGVSDQFSSSSTTKKLSVAHQNLHKFKRSKSEKSMEIEHPQNQGDEHKVPRRSR